MIDRLDHIVLNCRDVAATAAWYERALGLQREVFGPDGRIALKFGGQKINLRPVGADKLDHRDGRGGRCRRPLLIAAGGLAAVRARLDAAGVEDLGPVTRTGAAGPMTSLCAIPTAAWSRSPPTIRPIGRRIKLSRGTTRRRLLRPPRELPIRP